MGDEATANTAEATTTEENRNTKGPPADPERRDEMEKYPRQPGEIYRSRSRASGSVLVMLDATNGDVEYDPANGRWVAVCLTHNQTQQYPTRRSGFAQFPLVTWSDDCAEYERSRGYEVTPFDPANPPNKGIKGEPGKGPVQRDDAVVKKVRAVRAKTAEIVAKADEVEETLGSDENVESEAEALPV